MFIKSASIDELKKNNKKNSDTHISLFTGCGGLDLGFSQAGWHTRVMIEWEKQACETLRANWTMDGLIRNHYWRIEQCLKSGDEKSANKLKTDGVYIPHWYHKIEPVIMERDITTVKVSEVLEAAKLDIGECGIVTGGFPCQGFSHAGPRMIDDPRNVLYKECVRMIRGIMPKFFMLENVPGLISMDKGKIINQICTDLAESGYQVSWQKLNAADYGVPQNRIRIIIIGERNDAFIIKETGNPQFHMGGVPGPVKHPDFYIKKYKIHNKYEEKEEEN